EFDTERKEYKVSVVFHLSWGIDKRTIEKIQISSPQNLWITKSKGKWKIKSIYKPDIFSKEGIKKFAIRYQKDFPEMSKDILEKF
ncbi:MAG: hypothetical protein L6Q54_15835, partial [Leptospiraceae bacterium]|nr:hypothetical protein [Leptospiraceae bacterium]